MVCPQCKAEIVLRTHCAFVYQHQAHDVRGHDLEAVLASCPTCRVPVILLRHGESTEVDGLVELVRVDSEQVLYP